MLRNLTNRLKAALRRQDKEVKEISRWTPGTKIFMSDRIYVVTKTGAWKKVFTTRSTKHQRRKAVPIVRSSSVPAAA